MNDLLTQQAAIKARNKLVRDRSGQFATRDSALQYQAAFERMNACLLRDAEALERSNGLVWHKKRLHKLPNPDRLAVAPMPAVAPMQASVEHTAEVLPLFEQRVAA